MARPGLDLDTPLSWPGDGSATFQTSLREVIEAVDANRTELVQRVRRALALMKDTDVQTYRAVLRALARHGDPYRTVLVRPTHPAVVDGSNAAWQAPDSAGRPRLDNLLALRHELLGLGYFPLFVYVDAALPHQIDRRSDLERLVARGEVLVADPGTDADDAILRHARDLDGVVVSNDRMREHDPEDRVTKLRFEVGPDGASIRNWHEHQ